MKHTCLAACVLALCGCQPGQAPTVTADLTYSNAGGFGTQNAGDYRPGALFLWDTATNEMQPIDTLSLTRVVAPRLPGDRTSERVSSIGITGLPGSLNGQEGLVGASIGARSAFSVTGGYREDHTDVVTALASYVRALVDAGADADQIFHPRDADSHVVVIRSALRAQASSLRIGGADVTDGDRIARVALASPVGEIAAVNVRAGTSTTCGAPPNSAIEDRPVCFFNVVVYKPHYQPGVERMQFRLVQSFPRDNLAQAFRSLN